MSLALFKCNNRISTFSLKQYRSLSSVIQKNDEISPIFTNRNPRNLEKLRIAYKPDGYYVDKKGKCFWHKLQLTRSAKHVTVSLIHFENGEVLKATTKEWAIKKQLYGTRDVSAYINLARVFARRCLESGLIEMSCDIQPPNEHGRIASFLQTLQEEGVKLFEPDAYPTVYPWTRERPEKPWEVVE